MKKKLAELLVKHYADWEVIESKREQDSYYLQSKEYQKDYEAWSKSGDECVEEIGKYHDQDLLASFYGNGKTKVYECAKKYLEKLEKNRKK